MDTSVADVTRIPIELPFREVPARNMPRWLPHWKYFEIIEVELESGHVGHGENMLYYGWGETTEEDVQRVLGDPAGRHMWNDSLGGLQIALFDAVGRAEGVPVHSLLGTKVREETPLGWWCIPMSPDDWVAECETARERGYTDVKLKGRPWFDLRAGVAAIADAVPESFGIGIDFNSSLLDADRAIPVLQDLDEHPQVTAFETPIPQEDVEGNKRIREAVDADLAQHNGRPAELDELTQFAESTCEKFVLGTGGIDRLTDDAAVAAQGEMPFWLQQVGTGVMSAFSLHTAAVFEYNRLPAVNCHQLYDESVLVDPITVEDGHAAVPDAPGLGVEVDMDTVEELRTERPESRPSPPRLIETDWPDGPTIYFSTEDQMNDAAMDDALPYFERGVETRLVPDDDSERWERLHDQTLEAPVVEESPVGL